MKKEYVMCSLLVTLPICAWFAHDKAVYATQQNNWKQATALLKEAIVDDSENPSLLYDAGVASFKHGDTDQAAAYFCNVTKCESVPLPLKERAFFNYGNVSVKQNNFKVAIASYESALDIEPEDQRAKHNLEIVKEMLKKSEQEQQDNQAKNKNEKNNNQQQKNNDNEQKKNESDGSNDKDSDDSKEGGGQNKKNQQERDDKKRVGQKNKDEVNREQNGDSHQQKDADQDTQRMPDNKSSKQPGKNQQGDNRNQTGQHDPHGADKQKEHANSSSQQDEQNANKDEHNDQTLPLQQATRDNQQLKKLDAWLANILKEREKHDAHLNKQMIRATVGQQMAGRDGENCW